MNCIPVGMADLSGIGGKPGDLFVNNFIHKAFVEVNEEGKEQAFNILIFFCRWMCQHRGKFHCPQQVVIC